MALAITECWNSNIRLLHRYERGSIQYYYVVPLVTFVRSNPRKDDLKLMSARGTSCTRPRRCDSGIEPRSELRIH